MRKYMNIMEALVMYFNLTYPFINLGETVGPLNLTLLIFRSFFFDFLYSDVLQLPSF